MGLYFFSGKQPKSTVNLAIDPLNIPNEKGAPSFQCFFFCRSLVMPQNVIFHIRAPSLQTVCSCLGMDLTSMGQQEDLTATLMAPQLGGTMEVPMAPARGPTASMEASPTTPTALMEILMAPRLAGLMAILTAPQLGGLMAILTAPQLGGLMAIPMAQLGVPMEIPMPPHQGGLMEIPTAPARGPTASMEASPTVPTALTEILMAPRLAGLMAIPTAPQLEGLMAIRTEPQPGGPMEIRMQPHQGLMEIPTAPARGPMASMEASPTVPTALTEIPTEPQRGGPMEINMERGPTNMVFINDHKFIVRNHFWTKP